MKNNLSNKHSLTLYQIGIHLFYFPGSPRWWEVGASTGGSLALPSWLDSSQAHCHPLSAMTGSICLPPSSKSWHQTWE